MAEQNDREQLQSTADAMLRDFGEYKLKAQAFSDMLQEERDRLEENEVLVFSRYNPGSAFDDGFSLDTRGVSKLESHIIMRCISFLRETWIG